MRKGERTRQRIIEQAASLFNQRGVEGCSMQDILAATQLEKGGVYRHFASKEDLAREAFLFSVSRAAKTRTDGLEHLNGAVEKLRFVIHRFVEEPSPVAGGCPLLNTAIESDDGSPLLRKLAKRAFSDWRKRIQALIEDGIRAGELNAQARPAQLADTIIAALEGGLVLSRLDGDREALRRVEASLIQLLEMATVRR